MRVCVCVYIHAYTNMHIGDLRLPPHGRRGRDRRPEGHYHYYYYHYYYYYYH